MAHIQDLSLRLDATFFYPITNTSTLINIFKFKWQLSYLNYMVIS